MKKIIKLTESDLTRIIKRIINEEQCLEPPQILLDYEIGSSKFKYTCNTYHLIYNFASYIKDQTKFGFAIYIELELKKGMLQFDKTNLNNNLPSVINNLKSILGGEFIGPRESFDVGDNKARFNFTFEDDADLETKLNGIKSQLDPLLTESNLTNILKRIIKEIKDPEPVITGTRTAKVFYPNEGDYKLDLNTIKMIKDFVRPFIQNSKKTIETFYNNPTYRLPKFIEIGAHTTSGGSAAANEATAQNRINTIKNIIISVIQEVMPGINEERIKQFLTTNTDYTYTPTSVDSNLYDRTKVNPKIQERYAYIKVSQLSTLGLDYKGMNAASKSIQSPDVTKSKSVKNSDDVWNLWGLMDAGYHTEYYTEPNEYQIWLGTQAIRTYSDAKKINDQLENANRGGLATVVNTKLKNNTKYWNQACSNIKKAFVNSGKAATAVNCKRFGDMDITW